MDSSLSAKIRLQLSGTRSESRVKAKMNCGITDDGNFTDLIWNSQLAFVKA
jgi:hypothetical protein